MLGRTKDQVILGEISQCFSTHTSMSVVRPHPVGVSKTNSMFSMLFLKLSIWII